MKLIKTAIVFNAEMPNAHDLATKLEATPFADLLSNDVQAIGFIPTQPCGEYVASFIDGYAFTVRHDQKVVPASAIKQRLKEWEGKIEAEESRRIGRKERKELKERVTEELLTKALAKTTEITVFYDTACKYLIIPVSSRSKAQMIMTLLIKALESVKTSTIHISDVAKGVTAMLADHLSGNDAAFGDFHLGDKFQLVNKKEKVSFDQTAPTETATKGLTEALAAGFAVKSLQLVYGAVTFNLTNEFHLKSIQFEGNTEHEAGANAADRWAHEASIQTLMMSGLLYALCELIGYAKAEEA
jgi:recombination associated protein RdgC